MTSNQIEKVLEDVRQNRLTVAEALDRLRDLPFEDLGFARIDHHRELRTGIPEIVFGEGKEVPTIAAILKGLIRSGRVAIVSRLSREKAGLLQAQFPDAEWFPEARLLVARRGKGPGEGAGTVAVVAAGTSDIPVAEEAGITAQVLGNELLRVYDVGVAGLPRLLAAVGELRRATVLIVVAGMEGALPSVVAGLVGRPVVAVPTSVGYGTSFGGITALLAMLNSCVPGVTVVNIDNGVGAGVAATLIARVRHSDPDGK